MPRRKEHKIIDNIECKHCNKCDQWKKLENYNKQSSRWDKLFSWCRECQIKDKQNKRKTEKYINYDDNYYKIYVESGRRKEVDRIRYENNKEEIKKKTTIWQKNNPDKVAIIQKNYVKRNKEKVKKKRAKYRKNNKEKRKNQNKKYRMENLAREKERFRNWYWKKRGMEYNNRRIKKYELEVKEFFGKNYDIEQFLYNRAVTTGCEINCTGSQTHRFPDFLFDGYIYPIIVEVDENKHRGAGYSCDYKRMAEIAGSLGEPCIFIRYNPTSKEYSLKDLKETVDKYLGEEYIEWDGKSYNQFKSIYLY